MEEDGELRSKAHVYGNLIHDKYGPQSNGEDLTDLQMPLKTG